METSIQGTLGSERPPILRITRGNEQGLKHRCGKTPPGCRRQLSSCLLSRQATRDTWILVSGNNSSLLSPQKILHLCGLTQMPPSQLASATRWNGHSSDDQLLSAVCPWGDRWLLPGAQRRRAIFFGV